MIRARAILEQASGEAAAVASLAYDDRHRRRLAITTKAGERVLIDLPDAVALRHGARLALEDGRTLAIEAQPEPVVDILAADAVALARLAWHLGNRHCPTAVLDDRLRIRRDHVLEAMAEALGATLVHRDAPFDPEAGAYHTAHAHGPTHAHGHAHTHAHANAHTHTHAHPDAAGHPSPSVER